MIAQVFVQLILAELVEQSLMLGVVRHRLRVKTCETLQQNPIAVIAKVRLTLFLAVLGEQSLIFGVVGHLLRVQGCCGSIVDCGCRGAAVDARVGTKIRSYLLKLLNYLNS